LTGGLKDAYYSIEDQYYSLLDYLEDEQGIPVYEKFVEPIESSAIPSFPVAILSVIVVIAALFGIASLALAPNTATVTINLVSTDGQPVSEANVTLFVDNAETGERIASRISNYSGVAVFEKVPLGISLFVSVFAPDFKEYLQPLAPLTRDAPFAQIELESLVDSSESSFKLLVRDDSNLPVLGATVTAHTVTGTLLANGVQVTNAFGAAQFEISSREFLAIDVEKEGYESVYGRVVDASRFSTETVVLSKKADAFKARTVKVIAVTSNSTGGTVSAEVALYTIAGSELGRKRTQESRASFDVPQGTEFYANAVATSNDTGKYFEYFSEQLVAEDDINEFPLKFIAKSEANSTNATCGTLRVFLQDESSAPLSGEVSLYLESTNSFVARKPVSAGNVSFDVCANSTLYAAAYSQGYFASNALGLRPGISALITLRAVTANNSGSVEVTALDSDAKTPVSGAIVSIMGSDSRFLAYPKQTTNADGRAGFSGLELGVSYYAFADKPSKHAKSSLFTIAEGAATKVTIVFGHSTARISVSPVDVLTGLSVNAVATARATGMPTSSCQVRNANNSSCDLTVYSGIPVTVEVTSSGYEKLLSSPFVLSESESVLYTASMLPSSLKNQFTVKYTGLFNSKGGSVSSVERGAQYDAKFIVNIPTNASAYKAGFILRIGTAGFDNRSAIDPLEHFVIIPKQYPQVPVNLMSYSYRPSTSCTPDIRNSSNGQGYYKWAYFLLDNASGVREVVARVQVKDNAYTDEKLRVSSSAWYTPTSAADSYLHIPADSDFGSSNRSDTRDWCYAKSDYRDYSVSSGKSYCGANACISVGFYDSDSNQTSQFKGITGRPFYARVSIDLLRAVSNPRVVIFSASQKARIHQYNVSTDTQNLSGDAGARTGIDLNLTQFYSNAIILLNVTFSDKADFSAFYADLYDGNTKLARAYGYVTQGGVGKLRIYPVPDNMGAASTYDLNVTLTDYYSSAAVEDALITLNESVGTPFSGRSYSVLGGSIADPLQGISGVYQIPGVFASEKGAFNIVAAHPDYLETKREAKVEGIDFLSTATSDLEVCGEESYLDVYNSHVLDSNVSITASKANCINVTAFVQMRNGTDTSWTDSTPQIVQSGLTYFLPLSHQNQGRITVVPAAWDKACSVTIAASARDGSQSTRTIAYSNCAEAVSSAFLSVSPSRVSNTASSRRCNRAAFVNVSNSLSTTGSVTVQLSAPGLVVELEGANQSLSTPFFFAVPNGARTSLLVYPTSANASVMMAFNATDGTRSANISIPFDNCPNATREAAPDILSYSPKDYARITTEKVSALVTVDTYAYCRIGPSNVAAKQLPYLLTQKSSSAGSYEYGTDLAYNKGSGTPFKFSLGRNTVYVGCCNPASKGGECTTSNVPISFDFQYVAPTSTPTPTPTPKVSGTPTPVATCLPVGSACTDYTKCCSAIGSEGKCAECSTTKPSASGEAYKGCSSGAPVCNSSYMCVQCTDSDVSFCSAGQVCELGKCKTQVCAKEDEKPTSEKPCCTGLKENTYGLCDKEIICKAAGEAYSREAPCCAGLLSGSDGKCAKATVCTKENEKTVCKSGEYCDIEQGACVKTPRVGSNTIKFDFASEKFTNADGAEVSGVTLSVSSVIPVAGFILTLDNSLGVNPQPSTAFNLKAGGVETAQVGVFYLDGTPVTGTIVVPSESSVDVIITYPDVRPDYFTGDAWGVNAGFMKDASGNLHFSASDAKLAIMGSFTSGKTSIPFDVIPNVIDTDAYTAGLAVFENTHSQFLPMDSVGSKRYDAYYEKPYDGEAYSLYMFNNNLMMKKSTDVKYPEVTFGFSDAVKARADQAAHNNVVQPPDYKVSSGFKAEVSGMPIDADSLYNKLRVMPVYSKSSVIRWFEITRVNLMTQTGGGSSTAITHDWMRQKFNLALQELYNLKNSLKGKTLYTPKEGSERNTVEPMAGEKVNALKVLHLGNGNLFNDATNPGRVDDIFIASAEAATVRVLWFKYNPLYMSYELPVDITGTYEYPEGAGIKIIPKTESIGLAAPVPKELAAFPGNKRNTAYFCDASAAPEACPKASDIYSELPVPDYFEAGSISKLYALTGSYSGGASFTNPASSKSELNPQAACPSTKMARNGECIGSSATDACFLSQSGEIVYFFDSKTRAYGWLGGPSLPTDKKCGLKDGTKGANCYSCYNGNDCSSDFTTTSIVHFSQSNCDDKNPQDVDVPATQYSVSGQCNQLNYNGWADSNGYTPFALLNPGRRCYLSQFTSHVFTYGCTKSGCPPQTDHSVSSTMCTSCSDMASGLDQHPSFCPECGCCSCSGPLAKDRQLSDNYPVQCERQSILPKGETYMLTIHVSDGSCPVHCSSD